MGNVVEEALKKAIGTVKKDDIEAAKQLTQREIMEGIDEEQWKIIQKLPAGILPKCLDMMGIPKEQEQKE